MIFISAALYSLMGILITASLAVIAPVLLGIILVVGAMFIPICLVFKVIKLLFKK